MYIAKVLDIEYSGWKKDDVHEDISSNNRIFEERNIDTIKCNPYTQTGKEYEKKGYP